MHSSMLEVMNIVFVLHDLGAVCWIIIYLDVVSSYIAEIGS